MEDKDSIDIFLEEYSAQLNFLETDGSYELPLVERSSTWGSTTYKVRDLDVALELSLDARDFVVSTYISLFSETSKPEVGYVSHGKVVRLFLEEVLERLIAKFPSVQEELKQWKASVERHHKRVRRSLKALKMPDAEVVRELFRTDAQWVAHFLRQYREEIIQYARNYWGL
jgi:hypothetical protein